MTLIDFVSEIHKEFFTRILDEQDGEMSQDAYNDKASDILHEEIDYAVTTIDLEEVEDHIHEYGIHKAFALYINEWGAEALGHITQENSKYLRCLLYTIVRDNATYSYEDYKTWCEC
jgi:ribosome-interacting GTPase 1